MRWSLLLIRFTKKKFQHRCFLVKFLKILRATILKNIFERVFLRILQEECWTQPQGFYILMNVYRNFKVCIPAWYTSANHESCIFIIYHSAGRERTKRFSTIIKIDWTKIHFNNLIWLAYYYSYSHPYADKWMPKVIFDHAYNVEICVNLASCSSWNQLFWT